jgi:hypothetical protein
MPHTDASKSHDRAQFLGHGRWEDMEAAGFSASLELKDSLSVAACAAAQARSNRRCSMVTPLLMRALRCKMGRRELSSGNANQTLQALKCGVPASSVPSMGQFRPVDGMDDVLPRGCRRARKKPEVRAGRVFMKI